MCAAMDQKRHAAGPRFVDRRRRCGRRGNAILVSHFVGCVYQAQSVECLTALGRDDEQDPGTQNIVCTGWDVVVRVRHGVVLDAGLPSERVGRRRGSIVVFAPVPEASPDRGGSRGGAWRMLDGHRAARSACKYASRTSTIGAPSTCLTSRLSLCYKSNFASIRGGRRRQLCRSFMTTLSLCGQPIGKTTLRQRFCDAALSLVGSCGAP